MRPSFAWLEPKVWYQNDPFKEKWKKNKKKKKKRKGNKLLLL
jgi:hypothetical protein